MSDDKQIRYFAAEFRSFPAQSRVAELVESSVVKSYLITAPDRGIYHTQRCNHTIEIEAKESDKAFGVMIKNLGYE